MSNKICKVEGCLHKVLSKGYCSRHYDQIRKLGRIKRTKWDANEIIVHSDYAEMLLYNGQGIEVARTLIDLIDIPLLSKYKWYLRKGDHGNNYVVNASTREPIHRFLLNVTSKNKEVDHRDRNTLNNRRYNLRVVTGLQNSQNRSVRKDSSSGIRGVHLEKRTGKYIAYITVNKQRMFLGRYSDITMATQVRINAEKEYFGEYRPIS